MPTIDYALSIGPNCRAKYHLRRHFGRSAVNGVFDWQMTPVGSCMAYLDADFVGLFERDDLHIRDGALRNKRWGTTHLHQLPSRTEAALDAHYATARSRHDHLCENFRSAIRSGKRVLIAFSRPIENEVRDALITRLRAYAGTTELFFVFEPPGGPWQSWKGDSKLWNRLLAPYRLRPWPAFAAAARRVARFVVEHIKSKMSKSRTGKGRATSEPEPAAMLDA